MSLNNKTQMEFLAGDANASWWRDGEASVNLTRHVRMTCLKSQRRSFARLPPTPPDAPPTAVYYEKGYEVHHMGYALPAGTPIWNVVTAFTDAGLGPWVQYGRWGTIEQQGSGCYVYMDSQKTVRERRSADGWYRIVHMVVGVQYTQTFQRGAFVTSHWQSHDHNLLASCALAAWCYRRDPCE